MATHEPLSVNALIARARKEAACDNFGNLAFVPPLNKLVDSINSFIDHFHEKGRQGIEDRIVRMLVNRLRMQRDIEKHPEILTQKLLPPVSITGLPRTGSTKLQRLLAAGKRFQEPLMWQVYNPAPFPNAKPGEPDPRIQAAVEYVASLMADAPLGQKGHTLIVEQAEEEGMLLEQTFDSLQTVSYVPAYTWMKYVERRDKTDMYEFLRQSLLYLQWQFHRDNPRPWLLKHPPNTGHETYIDRAFPGVKYIVTHRDPYPVLASLSQMVTAVQLLYCKDRDIKRFSRWAIEEFSSEMDRHIAWRDANPDAPVLDVSFKEIVSDGLGTARRIYDFLDVEWTREVEAGIQDWLVENEKQHDALEWSYEDVAFDKDECETLFAEYYKRFSSLL